jgi:hypothetical protein
VLWSANNERTKNQKTNRTMKKYIRSVVLICALNGVRVWAEAPCATKINSPEFGPWPAQDRLEYPNQMSLIPDKAVCQRSRGYQSCSNPDGAVGWTGYYCNDGPQRHHLETTVMDLYDVAFNGAIRLPCPHSSKTVIIGARGPTKRLSNNPCSYYSPGFVWPSFR